MAVVLVIIGLLILTIFPALTVTRMATQRAATQSNLQALMLATAAYVQANGCVPCPTPPGTTGSGFGRVGGSTTMTCGACIVAEGIPPYVSLGISANIAHDGWGRWISMRVDPALTSTTTVPPTGTAGICAAALTSSKSTTAVSVTTVGGAAQAAAVLFVSYGAKGYGAFESDALGVFGGGTNARLLFPSGAPSCPSSLSNLSLNPVYGWIMLSVCNADGKNQFVNSTMRDGYDDMMAFANRNVLVSMLNNGTACQTGP